jgi:poly(A) polymerase
MQSLSALRLHPIVQTVSRIAQDVRAPVYLVGGAVRDALCGFERVHDFDFALFDGFDELVAAFARSQRGTVIPWDVDQQRVVFRQGGSRITADFSRMRKADITLDLQLRDFTVNAMALALHEPGTCLIDPLGGQADIQARCLRMCSEQAFEADPLRMLRAFRFARQLSCAIEPLTLASIHRSSALIVRSARERVKRELFAILHAPEREASLRALFESGLLAQLLPDIAVMDGVQQSAPHEHTLFEHCLRTAGFLDEALRIMQARRGDLQAQCGEYLNQSLEEGVTMMALLSFAALLHDIGKPACASEHGGRIHFYGHERSGARIIRRMARGVGLGRTAQSMLAALVENHMRILHMSLLESVSERAKARFVRDCGPAAAGVCLLAIADSLATGASPAYRQPSQHMRAIAAELCARILVSSDLQETAPLLTGADVMAVLQTTQGPQVGRILKQSAQLERDGTLQDREAALAWLRNQKTTD